MDEHSADLLLRYQKGEDDAAEILFSRYLDRLIRLARSRLSSRLAGRIDPEDIVMSAYRSFFIRTRQGQFEAGEGFELWRLLATITLHKLYRQVAFHRAERRSVEREAVTDNGSLSAIEIIARGPSPAEAAAIADETEQILSKLTRTERAIVERRLQGNTIDEIAGSLHCSEKTVRRTLERIRERLTNLLPIEERTRSQQIHPRGRPPKKKSALHIPIDNSAPGGFSENDFILKEMIGAGGMGKVYRATLKTGGERAVKFLRKAYLNHEGVVRRFIDEAKIVARLKHPGIVPIHGLGRAARGSYFIVMDLVRGPDLAKLAKTRAISVADAVRWVREAALAIQHAHESGIIHCDLKPSNLLLDADGTIRVTDFGLARQLAKKQPEFAELAGTAAFMAPEQVDACWGKISERTDVYGLGAVLYTLLTNLPPYVGTAADVLAQVVCGRPHPGVAAVRSNVSAELISICTRCMVKNPAKRFASANELATALQSFL